MYSLDVSYCAFYNSTTGAWNFYGYKTSHYIVKHKAHSYSEIKEIIISKVQIKVMEFHILKDEYCELKKTFKIMA